MISAEVFKLRRALRLLQPLVAMVVIGVLWATADFPQNSMKKD